MRYRLPIFLFALLALAQSFLMLPAVAAETAMDRLSAAPIHESAATPVCPANGKALNLAQIAQTECCKGQKGICGCRAGKIVCCDGKASPHPGCTCHGDEGFAE